MGVLILLIAIVLLLILIISFNININPNNVMIIQIVSLCLYILSILIHKINEYIKIHRKYKIIKDDENKLKYYREIIDNYSISELGYIFNGNNNIQLLIMAELEYLKMIKVIDINDGNIIILRKDSLRKTEQYLIEHYKFINDLKFKMNYLSVIEESLKEKNAIVCLKNKVNQMLVVLFFIVFFTIYMGVSCCIMYDCSIRFVILEMLLLFGIGLVLIFTKELLEIKTIIKKTSLGENIYMKLNGLKNYLKDVGNFDEKNLDEIKLWDEYILYAIILDVSDGITESAKKELDELIRIVYKH